jgi:hypothetical protein
MHTRREHAAGLLGLLAATTLPGGPTGAQTPPVRDPNAPIREMSRADIAARNRVNAWTLGLAAGLLEGAPIRFAAEIARVVDDREGMHVLPVVTRGPADNVEALLYLRGIDLAIINTDVLEPFRRTVPNLNQRIAYILNLFPSELHILVRPEINSLGDLRGKRVNFNTPGTAAAYSGPLIFERLGLAVDRTFIPHPAALEQMRRGEGEIAAAVFVTSKPVDAFTRGRWDPGFKFLPVDIADGDFVDVYLPSTLTSRDYPLLIPEGQTVTTIAVPTILAAYNWTPGSERVVRMVRFVDHLFSRIERFHAPGFHPAWRDVNLAATVPGIRRYGPAQEWLDRASGAAPPARPPRPPRPAPAPER